MTDSKGPQDSRCGHNFEPRDCPYEVCGYRDLLLQRKRDEERLADMEQFVSDALRTDVDYEKIRERLQAKDVLMLLHAGIGLATEVGEFLDQLKRHIFYGKPLDTVNLLEELGDTSWYERIGIAALGARYKGTVEANVAKLKKRYPEKFTEQAALSRDLDAERKVLEWGGSVPAPAAEPIPAASSHAWTLEPGFYMVRFSFGVEPARWDGGDWLRCGGEITWNSDAVEILYRIAVPMESDLPEVRSVFSKSRQLGVTPVFKPRSEGTSNEAKKAFEATSPVVPATPDSPAIYKTESGRLVAGKKYDQKIESTPAIQTGMAIVLGSGPDADVLHVDDHGFGTISPDAAKVLVRPDRSTCHHSSGWHMGQRCEICGDVD